ncbi:hypothetical protein P4C99_13795 [Pontiellaceae bacterium B1224]|nr:hypothetical protein [Pontiellaceae bacterium B1224]
MVGKLIQKILWLFIASSMAVHAVEYDSERYELILERSPFGEDPLLAQEERENAKEAAEAAAAAKKMEKEMRLCYLNETQTGEVRAAFQNLRARPGDPQSIMLTVGESFNGMKLSEVDLATSSATLMLNGKRVTFELTQSTTPEPVAKAAAQPARKFGGGFRAKPPEQPAKPPEPTLTPEEIAKARAETTERLRQYQMEVIRNGMPPLPVPLTQEMDDQLVAEGVLPPGAE